VASIVLLRMWQVLRNLTMTNMHGGECGEEKEKRLVEEGVILLV
jgi:hypothetical protein